MPLSKHNFAKLESTQGKLIKQCLGLSKRSHNTQLLQALNVNNISHIVEKNVANLYHRIHKISSPARNIALFNLARYILTGDIVPHSI